MSRRGAANSWWNTLTAEQRKRCIAILPSLEIHNGRRVAGDSLREGWSVRMSPTTGPPTELEVIHRLENGKVLSVHPVMVKGRFVV